MPSTSHGHLTQMQIRLKRIKTRAEMEAYVGSTAFWVALCSLHADHRLRAIDAIGKAWAAYDAAAPVPEALSMRVSWTPERIAQLRLLGPRCKYDPTEIARQMQIPRRAVQRALKRFAGAPATVNSAQAA